MRYDLSPNKLAHIESVSKCMYNTSIQLGWSEEKAHEMSLLGFLHDFGYTIDKTEHALAGSIILSKNGYEYSTHVKHHGRMINDPPIELMLLWHADMSHGYKGIHCSYNERLKDIETRYGKNSKQAKRAKEIINYLNKHFIPKLKNTT